MKNKKLLLHAYIICLLLQLLSSSNSNAQIVEHQHITKSDTIIEIAKISGNDIIWDFSGLDLHLYPNTSDSDLVHGINPISVYENANLNSINDSLTGATENKSFKEAGIDMLRHGTYVMKTEGSGTLKASGLQYTDVKKVKITELYFHTLNDKNAVSYVNTYYLFFKGDTKELLFSVFNKKRNLNLLIGSEFTGVEYNKAEDYINNPNQNPLLITLSPNPAGLQTELSYTLINNANVTIEIMNQNNTVNKVIYSGSKDLGTHYLTIPLNAYSAGFYTIKITANGVLYAKTLIIE